MWGNGWPDNIFESCTIVYVYEYYTNIKYPTSLNVVCGRLAVVTDFVIVEKVILGTTHGGGRRSMGELYERWLLKDFKH